ncbi:MAG: hypothetical protein MMC33_003010 [Icmadophila ericetorum]|nr:hypothetical protein [Icmadophila ericetorum]
MEEHSQASSASSEPVPTLTEIPTVTINPDNPARESTERPSAVPPSLKNDEPETPASPSRFSRPKLTSRKSSGTIIIPRDSDVQTPLRDYPPDDARAMSPRRSSSETEKLGNDARLSVQEHARNLQSGLIAIAEKIENVKSDHEKLEKQNAALQDYIGGLTRSMSKTDIGSSKTKK